MSAITSHSPAGYLMAGPAHRVLAFSIDVLPALVAGYLAARWAPVADADPAAVAIVAVSAIWVGNRLVSTALTGRSLGKKLTGLTVVRTQDPDSRVGLTRATTREALTLGYFLPAALGFAFLFTDAPQLAPLGLIALLWLTAVLALPLVGITRSPLKQCPVSDSVCRTAVLAD